MVRPFGPYMGGYYPPYFGGYGYHHYPYGYGGYGGYHHFPYGMHYGRIHFHLTVSRITEVIKHGGGASFPSFCIP